MPDTAGASAPCVLFRIIEGKESFERAMIRQRVKAGLHRARAQGKRLDRESLLFESGIKVAQKMTPLLGRNSLPNLWPPQLAGFLFSAFLFSAPTSASLTGLPPEYQF
jgi:hypothetical protein